MLVYQRVYFRHAQSKPRILHVSISGPQTWALCRTPHFLPHNEELICGEPSLHRELVDVCRPFEVPGRLLPLNVELLSC